MTILPPGVTLQQIDGGPTYFADHGFTYAVNMGWDDPNFFSIGIFNGTMRTQADADRWNDLGLNTMVGLGPNPILPSDLALMQNNGISYISGGPGDQLASPWNMPNWVGNISADEPSTFAGGVSTPLSTTPNEVQDHRFWYMNNNWFFVTPQLGGLSPVNSSVDVLDSQVATPNGSLRHIDLSSTDMYWFAGIKGGITWMLHAGGVDLNHLGRDFTVDEALRGSNYGDMIDAFRVLQADHFPAPIPQFIENGGPASEDTTGATYITPPELNWAVWSSLIHGARQIIYFNHSFGGPAQSADNLSETFYQTVQPGQTISIYDQVKATDAMVQQMAPVLNSPFAFGYVHVNGGYNDLTPVHTLGGIETAAHYYNGNFYIFADTRESETQHNIPATFILNDPAATSVTVLNEGRTIPVVNGSFSDTFANASTVHIYQLNDGGFPTNVTLILPAAIQNDYLGIVRLALPLADATTIANAINIGTQTESAYIGGLLHQVVNTTIPAVAVEGSMYGAVGTSAEITLLATQFLPPQVAVATQLGLNTQVYACEGLGLALAFGNETGSTAFADAFGPSNPTMPNSKVGDLAFATAAATAIFGSASTGNFINVMDTWLTNWKAFYTSNGLPGIANATAAQIDLAARGAAWGDAVGVGLADNLGPLKALATNFLMDAAEGIATYSMSLVGQTAHHPFQGEI